MLGFQPRSNQMHERESQFHTRIIFKLVQDHVKTSLN